MTQPMYRAHIVTYPITETREVFRTRTVDYGDGAGWHEEVQEYEAEVPKGWEASPEYIERFGTDDWIEPATDKWFKSRSSAASRVELLNSMGYVAIVQQSAPVQWPRDGQKRVEVSDWERIKRAVRELVDLGVIKSADEIL